MANAYPHVTVTHDQATAASDSDVIYTTRRLDETGQFIVYWDSDPTGTFTAILYGRLTSDAPWYPIQSVTNADAGLATSANGVSYEVDIVPQMYISLSAISGATVTLALQD